MTSFLFTIILLNFWITIITTIMVIVWFNIVENIQHHTRDVTILMFSFAILAGIAWPLTLQIAFLVMMMCAIKDIVIILRESIKNKQK